MDGLSVLYQSTPEFQPLLYSRGNAVGWLSRSDKTASAPYNLCGRLYLAKSGWLLLSVPNAFVRGVFDALTAPGAELPTTGLMNVPNVDGDVLNAHISVMTAAEVEQIGADKINERGHMFHYALGPVEEIPVHNVEGVSKVWAVQIKSPALAALRKSYGLSPYINNNHQFHITVAARRKNVLGNNEVSKFDTATGRGELKAAADDKTTYDCCCSGPCMCPPTCICKKSGYCGHSKKEAADVQERVRVVLPYNGKYLLETLNNPKWPENLGKRRFIGGGIEAGETPAQAAAREMFEELGVKIKPNAFKHVGNDPDKPHEHYVELAKHKIKPGNFNATVGSDAVISLSEGLPAGADYIGPDIKKLLAPVLKKAVDLLPGGAADNKPDSAFPKKELQKGKKHEHEHTNNDQVATEIAKDHLQEDPDYYKKHAEEEVAQENKEPKIILQLRAAKEHSDNKRYAHKNEILRKLMHRAPDEWFVDDPTKYHMGITHAPTKFRFHVDPRIIPVGVPVQKAASKNPYAGHLFDFTQPLAVPRNSSLWQKTIAHLERVVDKGNRTAEMQKNTQDLFAAMDPGYKHQRNMALARGEWPKPDIMTQLIQRHGSGVLSALK